MFYVNEKSCFLIWFHWTICLAICL